MRSQLEIFKKRIKLESVHFVQLHSQMAQSGGLAGLSAISTWARGWNAWTPVRAYWHILKGRLQFEESCLAKPREIFTCCVVSSTSMRCTMHSTRTTNLNTLLKNSQAQQGSPKYSKIIGTVTNPFTFY